MQQLRWCHILGACTMQQLSWCHVLGACTMQQLSWCYVLFQVWWCWSMHHAAGQYGCPREQTGVEITIGCGSVGSGDVSASHCNGLIDMGSLTQTTHTAYSISFGIQQDVQLRFLSSDDIPELKLLCTDWFPIEWVINLLQDHVISFYWCHF